MKTTIYQLPLLKTKKSNLPRLFQKKTWTWLVRLQKYDNNPTISNYLYYCYLHCASCSACINDETANSYFDNMLLINKIKYSKINPLRFNKETETIKSFSRASENQNFKDNLIHFLKADNISDTLIQEFINNNIYLKKVLNVTAIKEKDNDPIKPEDHLEKENTQIKIREGVDLRTYKIVWEMKEKNPTNDLNLFKNKLEYETAFRLWMKETYKVNTMEKATILKEWTFSYKNKIIELEKDGKPLGQLRTQLNQIIANDDIFEAFCIDMAKDILSEFPE